MPDLAITSDQITGVGIGTIAVLVVVGVVIALLVAKLVVRVLVAVVIIALAVVVWTQRTAVVDAAEDAASRCEMSFFGVHIDPGNAQVKQACDKISRR